MYFICEDKNSPVHPYMNLLFSPFSLGSLELKNRLVLSPMCMYSAKNGNTTDFHHQHYISRAIGGVGLVMVEATEVSPEGRITPECLGIWNISQ